jgi:hypothetical protein
LADNLAHASFYIMGAVLLLAYTLFLYQLYKKEINKEVNFSSPVEQETLLIRYVAISILVFLLFNKVFSAQYMAWFCPLIPLLNIRYQNLIDVLLLIAGVFTIYIFPFNYIEFEYFENLPVLLMANRNLLMIIVFILILIGRKPQEKIRQGYDANTLIST